MVKFIEFCQQPSSQELYVNIAHIRIKTFRCFREYIKFVKVSFHFLLLDVYTGCTDYILNVLSPKFKHNAY